MKFEIKEPEEGKIGTIYGIVEKGKPVFFNSIIQQMKDELGEDITLFDTKPSILLNDYGTHITCYWRKEPYSHKTPKDPSKVLKVLYAPNCYLLLSGQVDGEWVKPIVSFFYDNGEIGAEWCPPYGPIQIWYKAEKSEDTIPHYFYEYVLDKPGSFSQMGADELPSEMKNGEWNYIFLALKEWSTR